MPTVCLCVCSMQKRCSTSVDNISACSGSFVSVTFSQLNENPQQRLTQPGMIREVQTHMLSSFSGDLTIFQSWQGRNKGSSVQIPTRFCIRRGGLLTPSDNPFSHGCAEISISPSVPFFHRFSTLCRKLGVSVSLDTSSSNLIDRVPYSPLLSLLSLCSTAALLCWLAVLKFSIFLALQQKVMSSSGGTMHQELLDPCFHFIWFLCAANVISAPLLFFNLPSS